MSYVEPSALQNARVKIIASYNDAYQAAASSPEAWWSRIATRVGSETESNSYFLADLFPKLREWVGARVFASLRTRELTVFNKDYEGSVKLNRNKINDNTGLSLAVMASKGLGRAAAIWPNDLIRAAIVGGKTGLCYDGQAFFSASHPLEVQGAAASTQSNLHTSMALTPANFGTVRTRARLIKGEDGDPIGLFAGKGLLVVPPELEDMASRIVGSDQVGYLSNSSSNASDSNIYKGAADVLVIPQLSSDSGTTWYYVDPSHAVGPFIFQERQSPTRITVVDREDAESVTSKNENLYLVHGRGAGTYGLWQLCHRCEA